MGPATEASKRVEEVSGGCRGLRGQNPFVAGAFPFAAGAVGLQNPFAAGAVGRTAVRNSIINIIRA